MCWDRRSRPPRRRPARDRDREDRQSTQRTRKRTPRRADGRSKRDVHAERAHFFLRARVGVPQGAGLEVVVVATPPELIAGLELDWWSVREPLRLVVTRLGDEVLLGSVRPDD